MDKVTKYFNSILKTNDEVDIQAFVCYYIIDNFGIRFGSEDKDNDVVGVTQFTNKNIILKDNNMINIKFIGKDSVQYDKIHKISQKAYDLLYDLKKGKKQNDYIFPDINDN